ncbi:MAG: hypothetical protein H7Y17_16455 [Chlorobia bacterium]|nr:hypothetical protein [Fimbriimonadaceae bacterium]
MVYFVGDSLAIEEAMATISQGYPGLDRTARFIEYSQLLSLATLPSGTYVFTGTVDFDDGRRELSIQVERHMRQQGDKFRVLNSPLQSRAVSECFKTCFAGNLLSDASIKNVRGSRIVQPIHGLGHHEVAMDSDELPFCIAELVLRGVEPHEIGLFESLEGVTHVLIYSSLCMQLAGTSQISPTFASRFSLDVFGLEFAVIGKAERAIAISDRLADILPRTKPGSPIAMGITKAVLGLDSIQASDPVISRWNWQALGNSLGLKNPA